MFRRRKLRIPVAAASVAALMMGLAAIPTASGALPSCVNLPGIQVPGVTCQAPTTPAPTTSSTSSTPTPPPPTTASSPPSTTTTTSTTTTSTSSSSHTTTQKQAPPPRSTGPSTNQRPSTHRGGSAGKPSGSGQTGKGKGNGKGKGKGKGKGSGKTKGHKPTPTTTKPPSLRSPGGTPTASNPTFSFALPGAAPIGVPNFFIDSFRIPPFLIPIYQAAGIQYDIPWQILAGINEIETDYGRNLSVSSANAVGWMQFLPSTWKTWGVDANGDGVADPYNPVDAIFAAARYLHAAGGSTNLSQGIFAYNHAGWYVQSVLLRAKLIGGMPDKLIGALTGLVQGHFPVAAKARYADDSVEKLATRRVRTANAAVPVGSTTSRSVSIYARKGAPVIAVNDGKIVQVGQSQSLGRFVKLQDQTGNTYTYAHLGSVPTSYAVPKPVKLSAADLGKQFSQPALPAPKAPASAGQQQSAPTVSTTKATKEAKTAPTLPHTTSTSTTATASSAAPLVKERLFAHPSRPGSYAAGGQLQLRNTRAQISSFQNYFSDALHLAKNQYTLAPLKAGAVVIAGTVLGRIGPASSHQASHTQFMIQPAGKDAPQIDPKPILDGWKLLEATAVYRASGVDPFFGPGAKNPTIGQILLMSKEQLTNRILQDPHVQIYSCGRRDIQAGLIDRRVMATVEFLSASGLDPTVSGLECGHSLTGSSGTDAAGASGSSVDISKINNIPLLGHQGSGSIADITIRRLLTLQGAMKPDQIVSLMSYKGQNSTLALPDHNNRIQVTYTPLFGNNKKLSDEIRTILKPAQWIQLISRISQIPEPVVPIAPSKYALRTAGAH